MTTLQRLSIRALPSQALHALRGQPDLVLMVLGGRVHVSWGASSEVRVACGWQQEVREQLRPQGQALPVPFCGGLLGFLSYEAGRFSEVMPAPTGPRLLSDGVFRRYEGALVQDGKAWTLAGSAQWVSSARELLSELDFSDPPGFEAGSLCSAPSDSEFSVGVEEILERIAAGELYQVNLSRRLVLRSPLAPEALFAQLPLSAHAAFLRQADGAVLMSNSPELFWSLRQGQVLSRPIKGTAPLGHAAALLADPKERAELTMIVDLMRNDLGRVCAPGSVSTTPRRIIELPTLLHAEQSVHGRLRAHADALDLLDASFPPGSVTGAPKVQAMRLIHELEPTPRGAYTGVTGAFMDGGDAEFAVSIRVAQWRAGELAVHVGGGIVADSLPLREVRETWLKAQAWLRAVLGPGARELAP